MTENTMISPRVRAAIETAMAGVEPLDPEVEAEFLRNELTRPHLAEALRAEEPKVREVAGRMREVIERRLAEIEP